MPPNMPVPREFRSVSQPNLRAQDKLDFQPVPRSITPWDIFEEAFEEPTQNPSVAELEEPADEGSEWSETSEDDSESDD